ncbi:MAG TPA: FkbM family methyltransferase [Longimicrobium sp.]|jgi:FkbM family methyltransferase|nr:FkbM family methyltransferase [Longimicrobium sp.]
MSLPTAPFLPAPVRRVLKRVLLRPATRADIWWSLLRRVRAPSAAVRAKLIASAVADLALSTVAPRRAVSPRTLFSGRVLDPASGAWFHFRAGTDDLYNAMPGGEMDVHEAILAPLGEGDVFVDVGANVGYYTVLAAGRVGATGQVLAFEATPGTARQLRTNLEANGLANVEVVEAAVHDGSRERLTIGVPAGVYGMASVMNGGGANVASWEVAATTLAQACARFPRIRMVKMDIEGAELAALRGAEPILARVENLVVECNRGSDEIVALLERHGFEVSALRFGPYVLARRPAAAAEPAGSPAARGAA